ncbi:MAG TPA: class I SAM-dependent methyltransferase [Rhizomicrobium sp.]|nr:class I SAM-dependent methyltransferase [Rhizomicrobium sp.]
MSDVEQRFTFNQVAQLYDAARPSYPEALFDDCIAAAALRPGEAILEVGSGTGKATEAFARRGFPITALEPGAQMIATAQNALARFHSIRFVETTFEAWKAEPDVFGLVAAAQSWHWVDPAVSFAKAARVLRPDGVLAVFGNVAVGMPPALGDEIHRIYEQHLPGYSKMDPESAYQPGGPFAQMFDASGYFEAVVHKVYPWRWSHTAESYVAFLGTMSDHRLMEAATRGAILAGVADAIAAHGGSFEMDWEAHLYWARKR